MVNLWLGDFRVKQLQYWQGLLDIEAEKKAEEAAKEAEKEKEKIKENLKTKNEDDEDAEETDTEAEEDLSTLYQTENLFIFDNVADFSWFESRGIAEIEAQYESTNAIIMLGYYDCLMCCTYPTISIEDIAAKYITKIKEITEQFSNVKMYFCSVGPVDASCPGINYKGDLIDPNLLNSKIEIFNKIIKSNCLDEDAEFIYASSKKDKKEQKENEKCNVVFIDIFKYLTSTSFDTRDGSRYNQDTCNQIIDFVKSHIRVVSGVAFSQRTEEPDKENANYFSNNNVFHASGWGMPNCTAYAWGRFYEISGEKPKLHTGNAERWFAGGPIFNEEITDWDKAVEKGTKYDSYERGLEPRVGAVMCWSNPNKDGGHVAIVEEIVSDTELKVSESGYPSLMFQYSFYKKNSSGDWYGSSDNSFGLPAGCVAYPFQGFIYNPKISGGGSSSGACGDYISKDQVINECRILDEEEQKINARYIWQYLGMRGWTLNAVAGMLGNMQSESFINPNMYEFGVSGHPKAKVDDEQLEEIEAYFKRYNEAKGRYPGCGLTGWTWDENGYNGSSWEDNKYIKWCKKRNLDFRDIDSGLERILWEVENNKQWTARDMYPKWKTFKAFTQSTDPAENLAACFCATYEICVGWDTESVQSFRGKRGKTWFEYLLPFSPGMPAPLSLVNLKIDKYKPTEVEGSFVARNAEKGCCQLFKGTSKSVIQEIKYKEKDFGKETKKEKEEKKDEDSKVIKSADITRTITFKFSNLVPDTSYRVYVKVNGDSEDDEEELEIEFKTPQDYPRAVSDLQLVTTDTNFPNEIFELKCTPNTYWGHWKKNGCGYILQLIINGKCVKEKSINKLNKLTSMKLSSYFGTSKLKLNDTVQICIRTWVKDDDGNKIFDQGMTNTTNSICMLTQPFVIYLNTDKYKK